MNANACLVAEKLRHTLRILTEARELASGAGLQELDPSLVAIKTAVSQAMMVAAAQAGREYQEQVQAFGHRRGALPLGDVIGRVLQMDPENLEALAVDPQFMYRDVAQRLLEIRAGLDGRVPIRSAIKAQEVGG